MKLYFNEEILNDIRKHEQNSSINFEDNNPIQTTTLYSEVYQKTEPNYDLEHVKDKIAIYLGDYCLPMVDELPNDDDEDYVLYAGHVMPNCTFQKIGSLMIGDNDKYGKLIEKATDLSFTCIYIVDKKMTIINQIRPKKH